MMSEKRKRRKWKVVVVVLLLLLAAPPLFVWIVKVRSDRAWNEFVAKWEAQGEHFDIAPLAPPKVPDADNLALHPVFAVRKDPISGLPIQGSENPHSPAIPDEIYELCYDPFLDDPANPDPREWLNLPPNSDPASLSDHLGEEYREWMIRLDDAASALREREQFGVETDWSKFLIDDEESSGTLLTSMAPVSDAARAFQLRSAIRRGSGDTSECADDIESILRLARAQAHLPLPINRVVQTGSVAIAVDEIKYGLASGLFTEPELIQLERELAKTPSGPELFRKALRFERALFLNLLEHLAEARRSELGDLLNDHAATSGVRMVLFRQWLSANRLALCENVQEDFLGPGGRYIDIAPFEKAVEARLDDWWDGFKAPLGHFILGLGSAVGIAEPVFHTEAELRHARVAIAIERYRLANGAPPPSLSALVPDYLPAIPKSAYDGSAIRYELRPDGTWTLSQSVPGGDPTEWTSPP